MSSPCNLPVNFSDIPDGVLLTATLQLIESNIGSSMQFMNPEFSDISDDEFIQASSTVGVAVGSSASECVESSVFPDISDDEFVRLPLDGGSTNRFRNPFSSHETASIVNEKFAKKTIDKSTWAVTLFGQWRADDRNLRCLSDKSFVYLDKPFGLMTDDELDYIVPLFLTEILKKDGSEYPPATLRDLVLLLQKFLEVTGRNVKFFSDRFVTFEILLMVS